VGGLQHVLARREMHIWPWWGNMNKTGHLEGLGMGGSIILK
jgi:hypothetical protein